MEWIYELGISFISCSMKQKEEETSGNVGE
jgi:hypothetical protein